MCSTDYIVFADKACVCLVVVRCNAMNGVRNLYRCQRNMLQKIVVGVMISE